MRLTPLLALLLLIGCAPNVVPVPPMVPAPPIAPVRPVGSVDYFLTESDVARDCSSAGGEWRPVCKAQRPMCVRTYKDAGMICSDSSQCEGRCIGDRDETPSGQQMAGRCEANNNPCGCTTELTGGVPRTICVD